LRQPSELWRACALLPYTPRAVSLPRQLDPGFASTDDIMAAASITRTTVKTWQDLGFLPVPLKISLGMAGGVFNRYPAWAVDRARFVAEKRAAGFTYDEVRAMLAKQDAQEARKAKAEPAKAEPAKAEPAKAEPAKAAPAKKAKAEPAKATVTAIKPAKGKASKTGGRR